MDEVETEPQNEIAALIEGSKYPEAAQAFLDKHGLIFKAVRLGWCCPPWSDCEKRGCYHGDKWRLTFTRRFKKPNSNRWLSQSFSFDFWDSRSNMDEGKSPDAYAALCTVSSDMHCPETLEDFCSEFGYDLDSRKAENTFRKCSEFAKRINAFFATREREDLQYIR